MKRIDSRQCEEYLRNLGFICEFGAHICDILSLFAKSHFYLRISKNFHPIDFTN